MPTWRRDDDKPVVQFDPLLEISPFLLFRLMRDGDPPLLVDARALRDGRSLSGAIGYPGADWEPATEGRVVVFDRDGSEAEPIVRRLQAAGFDNVRLLFGGLDLWEFALDPDVVGEETFLTVLD